MSTTISITTTKAPWFDTFCWLKHYFWRESRLEWTENEWAKKWGSPWAAHQNAQISTGRLCEILAEELCKKGFIIRYDEKTEKYKPDICLVIDGAEEE